MTKLATSNSLAAAAAPWPDGMLLQPLLVAAQPALDLVGGLFETRVGLVRAPLGLQVHA